jgi:tetratricopeptide (TPR) repeat protein
MDNASMSAKLADLFPGAFRGVADGDEVNDRLAASVEGVIRAVEQGGQPLSPDGPDPHYSLGLAYKEMGLHAEARKEFEQALALPVYRIDAALMIAACHQAEGQPRQALRQIEECLSGVAADDPKWAAVVCQAAALTAELGDPDGAVAQVRRVLAINPDDEPAAALLRRLQEGVGAKEPARPRAAAPRASEPAVEQPLGASARTTKDKRSRISYV